MSFGLMLLSPRLNWGGALSQILVFVIQGVFGGMFIGIFSQLVFLVAAVVCTDWEKQVIPGLVLLLPTCHAQRLYQLLVLRYSHV